MSKRHFLFLQGPATPFFTKVATALRQQGHTVTRWYFCGGDYFFGGEADHVEWVNHDLVTLPAWSIEQQQRHQFTDVLLFGDTRPVHLAVLKGLPDVATWVFEEGYLRPHWITLERDGVNGRSKLDIQVAMSGASTDAPPNIEGHHPRLWQRLLNDLAYRLSTAVLWPFFRRYKSHRPVNAFWEYMGWAVRYSKLWLGGHERCSQVIQNLADKRFHLFALQLDGDAQIQAYSPFRSVNEAIETVIHSFSAHAPDDQWLVIKNHPFATGVIDHGAFVRYCARNHGVAERVYFLEAGDLDALLQQCLGLIVVNSTTAHLGLKAGVPCKILGQALASAAGLSDSAQLDQFWQKQIDVDSNKVNQFFNTLAEQNQIPGGFYDSRSISVALPHIQARLEGKVE